MIMRLTNHEKQSAVKEIVVLSYLRGECFVFVEKRAANRPEIRVRTSGFSRNERDHRGNPDGTCRSTATRPGENRAMDLLKPLIALLAIVNPIGAIPFFLHFTQNLTRQQRQRTIRVSSVSACLVVAISAIAGLRIIAFFGFSIASFQVGGGLLLLISSLNMLNAQQAESRGSDVGD